MYVYVRTFVECVHRNALDLLNFDGLNSPHRTGLLGTFINIHDGIWPCLDQRTEVAFHGTYQYCDTQKSVISLTLTSPPPQRVRVHT